VAPVPRRWRYRLPHWALATLKRGSPPVDRLLAGRRVAKPPFSTPGARSAFAALQGEQEGLRLDPTSVSGEGT
jgi:hypothetical protein